jgi:chitodextrinase
MWSAATDDTDTSLAYEVLSGDRVIGTTSGTSFVDPNPTYPATYWVRAMDSSGNRSATSASVTEQGPDVTPPSAPTGLTATAESAAAVQLSWNASTDNVGVTGYQILRGGNQVGTASLTSFTDTTVAPGTTYSYTVKALDAAGNSSAASDPATVTTPTANPVLFSDDFTGTDGGAWQSAWTCLAANGSATTQGNSGVLAFNDVSGAYAKAQLTGVAARTDSTLLMSYQWNSNAAAAFFSVYLRGSGGWKDNYRPVNGYGLQLSSNSGTVQVQKAVNGTMTAVHSVSGSQAVSTAKQWLRVQVNGSTIQFRTWLDGQVEPSTWKSVDTDTSVTAAGQVYLSLNRGGSTNVGAKSVTIDNLQLFEA